jgi:hypothetical protein
MRTSLTRKQFLRVVIRGSAAGLAGGGLLAACGGDDGGGVDAPVASGDCLQNGTTVAIAANHGHVLTVPLADVQAGTPQTYDIRGTALHTHSVTLTAAHFSQLAMNRTVTISTQLGDHIHSVTIGCA